MPTFNNFFSNGKDKNKKANIWAKSTTAGSTSRTAAVLENDTSKDLVLRDKVASSYGQTRYIIPAHNEIKVTALQHTFYRLIVYAIVDEEECSSGNGSGKKNKKPIDTMLTIDSDELSDCKRIVISENPPGSEPNYTIKLTR